jgi:hypothetical protein
MALSLILEGDFPRLIDEWQGVPSLWDVVVESEINRMGGNVRNLDKIRLLLQFLAMNERTTITTKL